MTWNEKELNVMMCVYFEKWKDDDKKGLFRNEVKLAWGIWKRINGDNVEMYFNTLK